MCHSLLRSASLYVRLLRMDRESAEEVRIAGCPDCGGVLHVANYPRKPRGGPPPELENEYGMRLSFCCSGRGGGEEGECRRRVTPPSVRFLGRRVYLGVVVILVTAMLHGVTRDRAAVLSRELEVSQETLERWRTWWLKELPTTRLWHGAKGRVALPVDESRLPCALVERFRGNDADRLVHALEFLKPLTTTSAVVS